MSTRAGYLLLVVLLAFGAARSAALASDLKVGDLPPPKLGRHVKLSDYRGKIVIVAFWASWCPPCRKELPILAGIQKEATRDKLVVFAVDWNEDPERFWQIKRALRDVDLTLVSDGSGYLGHQYGVKALPYMVIIGRDGRIAAIHIGYSDKEIPILVNEINSLWTRSAAPTGKQAQPSHSPGSP